MKLREGGGTETIFFSVRVPPKGLSVSDGVGARNYFNSRGVGGYGYCNFPKLVSIRCMKSLKMRFPWVYQEDEIYLDILPPNLREITPFTVGRRAIMEYFYILTSCADNLRRNHVAS